MMAGVAKALADMANTMIEPDKIPGMTCGTMTRRMTVNWLAPSDRAAASVDGLMRCSDAQTAITMNGTITWVSAMMTPVLVYMRLAGPSARPTACRLWLIRPVEPNSKAQPRVRTTTETSNGPRTTIRNMPFQGLLIREST